MIAMDIPTPIVADCFLEADRITEHIKAVSDYVDLFSNFSFNQKVFVLEKGVFLRLNEPLKIKKMPTRNLFIIDSWKISISCDSIPQLPNKICREFLKLYSKAKANQLSEKEHEIWIKIVDSIDYQSLSIEYALPDYSEGKIIRKDELRKKHYIEWHDGKREWIASELSTSFNYLEIGDSFSAYLKRNRFNDIVAINNINLIDEKSLDFSIEDIPVLA
ncbi:MAG: hypothetical protein PHV82_10105 [Victivallaceae bacterium]|nr:hypothetical protein [Victivallaceae bacterium]